jgi:hypothetical protein
MKTITTRQEAEALRDKLGLPIDTKIYSFLKTKGMHPLARLIEKTKWIQDGYTIIVTDGKKALYI